MASRKTTDKTTSAPAFISPIAKATPSTLPSAIKRAIGGVTTSSSTDTSASAPSVVKPSSSVQSYISQPILAATLPALPEFKAPPTLIQEPVSTPLPVTPSITPWTPASETAPITTPYMYAGNSKDNQSVLPDPVNYLLGKAQGFGEGYIKDTLSSGLSSGMNKAYSNLSDMTSGSGDAISPSPGGIIGGGSATPTASAPADTYLIDPIGAKDTSNIPDFSGPASFLINTGIGLSKGQSPQEAVIKSGMSSAGSAISDSLIGKAGGGGAILGQLASMGTKYALQNTGIGQNAAANEAVSDLAALAAAAAYGGPPGAAAYVTAKVLEKLGEAGYDVGKKTLNQLSEQIPNVINQGGKMLSQGVREFPGAIGNFVSGISSHLPGSSGGGESYPGQWDYQSNLAAQEAAAKSAAVSSLGAADPSTVNRGSTGAFTVGTYTPETGWQEKPTAPTEPAYTNTGVDTSATWLCTEIGKYIGLSTRDIQSLSKLRRYAIRNHKIALRLYWDKGKDLVAAINSQVHIIPFYQELKKSMVIPVVNLIDAGKLEEAYTKYKEDTLQLVETYMPMKMEVDHA